MKYFTITAPDEIPNRRILKGDQLQVEEINTFNGPGLYVLFNVDHCVLKDSADVIGNGAIIGKVKSVVVTI